MVCVCGLRQESNTLRWQLKKGAERSRKSNKSLHGRSRTSKHDRIKQTHGHILQLRTLAERVGAWSE